MAQDRPQLTIAEINQIIRNYGLEESAAERPSPSADIDHARKGPGPTPPLRLTPEDELKFKRFVYDTMCHDNALPQRFIDQMPAARARDTRRGDGLATAELKVHQSIYDETVDTRLHRAPCAVSITKTMTSQIQTFMESSPEKYDTPIADGGGHGAVQMMFRNLLRSRHFDAEAGAFTGEPKKVVLLDFGAFGARWKRDLQEMAERNWIDLEIRTAEEGKFPSLADIDLDADIIFCANETSAGVSIPAEDFHRLQAERKQQQMADYGKSLFAWGMGGGAAAAPKLKDGTMIVDATSAAGIMPMPDGVAYSFPGQKVLGAPAEVAYCVIPKELRGRIAEKKEWDIPALLSLVRTNGDLAEPILAGDELVRSTSTKSIYETLRCAWKLNQAGGLAASIERAEANSLRFRDAIRRQCGGIFDFVVEDSRVQGNFNCVLKCSDPAYAMLSKDEQNALMARTHEILRTENLLYDVKAFPGGDGFFRVTTIHIDDNEQAAAVVDRMRYAYDKALLETLRNKEAQIQEEIERASTAYGTASEHSFGLSTAAIAHLTRERVAAALTGGSLCGYPASTAATGGDGTHIVDLEGVDVWHSHGGGHERAHGVRWADQFAQTGAALFAQGASGKTR